MAGIDNNTVLYLRGDSFSDLSPNNHSITNNGATISNSGKLGKAYSVKNSKFTVSSLNLGQYFTIESYVYLDSSISSHNTRALLNTSNGTTDNGNLLLWFYYTGSKHSIELHIGDHINWGTNVIHAISPSFDKWIHIAITRSGSKFTLFIDGINVGTTSYNMSNFTHVIFGDIFNATERRYLNGKIENIMISDNVKYTQNFTPPTKPFNSININVTNKDFTKADFNISKLGQETINKVEIVQKDEVKETYIDSFDNLTFNHGGKNFKIVVTYDDNYTEEQEIHIGNSKAKIYLYKEGNECSSTTGVWEKYNSSVINSGGNLIITSSSTTARGMACPSNIFNFSLYSTLCMKDLDISMSSVSNSGVDFRIGSEKLPLGNSGYAQYILLNSNVGAYKLDLYSLDVSDLLDNCYINICKNASSSNVSATVSFSQLYLETKENVISINSQNTSSVNFSCNNLDDLITITKSEVYMNGILSKSYTNNFDNLTYNIDNSLCGIGNNQIKIKVTYTQGDDIYETVEEVLTYTSTEKGGLPTSSSLKELIDRQELLTNSIEEQKNTLKSILESKNVEVSDSENKLSILIDKVNELIIDDSILYLYEDGKEYTSLTGGWDLIKSNSATSGVVTKNSDNMYLYTGETGIASPREKSVYACMVNLINLTTYSKLKATVENLSYGDRSSISLCVNTMKHTATSSIWGSGVAYKQMTTNGTHTVDISSLTGNYYIYVDLYGSADYTSAKASCNIVKIWLEK